MPPPRQKKKSKKRRREADSEEDEEFGQPSSVWTYDLAKQLADPRYERPELVEVRHGAEVTAELVRSRGLPRPIFMETEEGLGMGVPPRDGTFTVDSIRRAIGDERRFDIVEVASQAARQTTMADFAQYFKRADARKGPADRQDLFNCLSLEFSETPLNNVVWQPRFVSRLDWVGSSWPEAFRKSLLVPVPTSPTPRSQSHPQPSPSTDASPGEEEDAEEKVKYVVDVPYPKVQHYCLMSVSECFTDFHLDFGGTSVWYHVNEGEKVFWLIPPSAHNFRIFAEWQLGNHSSFFGELVSACHRVRLRPGNTFVIPSGWIHAVFTPKTSLVFGGNFLHDFAISTQLDVYEMESRCRVYKKFRYPMWDEMHWYTAARWVRRLTGRDYEVAEDEPLVDHVSGWVSAKTRAKQEAALRELEAAGVVAASAEAERKPSYAQPPLSAYQAHRGAMEEVARSELLSQGLRRLGDFLRRQAGLQAGRKGIPARLKAPDDLLADLDSALYNAQQISLLSPTPKADATASPKTEPTSCASLPSASVSCQPPTQKVPVVPKQETSSDQQKACQDPISCGPSQVISKAETSASTAAASSGWSEAVKSEPHSASVGTEADQRCSSQADAAAAAPPRTIVGPPPRLASSPVPPHSPPSIDPAAIAQLMALRQAAAPLPPRPPQTPSTALNLAP